MKMKFDFMLNAWLREVEVEGSSEEECLDNLRRMTAEELLEIAFVKDSDISEVDGEIVEQDYVVEASNIKYDITTEDVLYEFEKDGIDDPSPEEIERKLIELEQSAPESVILSFTCNPDDLDDMINDELSDELGMMIKNFKYKIISTK